MDHRNTAVSPAAISRGCASNRKIACFLGFGLLLGRSGILTECGNQQNKSKHQVSRGERHIYFLNPRLHTASWASANRRVSPALFTGIVITRKIALRMVKREAERRGR